MSRRFGIFSTLCATALTLASAPAIADVITFEDLPHEYELQGVGDDVFTSGYRFNYMAAPDEPYPVGFHSVGSMWAYNGRSTALLANSCSAVTTLTADDNNPLTIDSIDLAPVNGDKESTVTFEGVRTDGSVVSRAFRMRGGPGWRTFIFPTTFANLQSVKWTQGDCIVNYPHMFDNVVVRRAVVK